MLEEALEREHHEVNIYANIHSNATGFVERFRRIDNDLMLRNNPEIMKINYGVEQSSKRMPYKKAKNCTLRDFNHFNYKIACEDEDK